jgi:hypothetical protein
MNIIKILSNRSWHLTKETLKTIYVALIRSIIEYSSPIYSIISMTLFNKLKAIQKNCLRIIYKQPYDARTSNLLELSNITEMKEKLDSLN